MPTTQHVCMYFSPARTYYAHWRDPPSLLVTTTLAGAELARVCELLVWDHRPLRLCEGFVLLLPEQLVAYARPPPGAELRMLRPWS